MLQISIEPNLMAVHANMEVNKNYSFRHCALQYLGVPGKLNIICTIRIHTYYG